MARYTRHQLKEDRFAEAVQEQVSWAVEHRKKLTIAAIVVVLLVLIGAGGFFYLQKRDQQASAALSVALRIHEAPLRPASAPVQPGFQTFPTARERAEAAQKEFRKVLDQYPHTRSADFAQYWVGVTDMEMGDYAGAEKELKDLTGSARDDLAPLAKFALASVYRAQGKEKQAIDVYNELIARPSRTVPKSTAQLELAAMFERTQPAEAARIYEQIRKDDPKGPAADIAAARMGGNQPK